MLKISNTPKIPRHASDEHDFHVLGSRPFEHFARALHETQPDIFGSQLYGPDGQGQFGADHIAWHRSEPAPYLEVGQSKAKRTFGPSDLRNAAKEFTDHWNTHWWDKGVRRFILFVGCVIKSRKAADEIIALTRDFADRGIELQVWDAHAIYDRLPAAPSVVRTHLGHEWYARIFGEPAGPLTGLARDLARGDRGAFMVGGYVARLNQAETAELIELRRRTRRGESATIIAELETMLFGSPVADAVAPEVRAGQLRMLAGLVVRRDPPERTRQLLDEADALDGDSQRVRDILLLETIGPEAVLAAIDQPALPERAEVRAIAQLRLGKADAAFAELAGHVDAEEASAETLRVASMAKLAGGERTTALTLAERGVQRDPDARACAMALGLCHFHAALSEASDVSLGAWPQPVDQPLIKSSDAARAHLEAAEDIFARLARDQALDDYDAALMWRLGTLACMTWRRNDLDIKIAELEAANALPIPMLGWCMTRGLRFDAAAAAARCDAQIAAEPDDLETVTIRIALANTERDHALARRLLDEKRDALIASGHRDVYDYWSAVLDAETGQPGSAAAQERHPWLRLRVALNIKPKKDRLRVISAVLEQELAGNRDPRVILAAAQVLLDGGWHKTAVKAAPWLIEQVATAEAIVVAAHALYRNRRWTEVLTALESVDAFPGGKLPADLERLRAECQAAAGDLVGARRTSLALAQSSGQARDIWRTIEFHIATGASPAALALYEQHAERLAKPTTSHVLLANAVVATHPEAAARITRQLAAAAPDALVGAAFDLSTKLRLDAEQRSLIGRMSRLGERGGAGVSTMHIDDLAGWISDRNARIEEVFEKYANGHLPVHLLTGFRLAALPMSHLRPLLDPPPPEARTAILSTRYGRRYDPVIWPDDRSAIKLLADVTALLTAHGLDLLDAVERAFAPIHLAPDTINALQAMRVDVELPQPGRVASARAVLCLIDDGIITTPLEPQLDGYSVLWDLEGGEPEATLNLSRLAELAFASLTETRRTAIRGRLATTLDPSPGGAIPPARSLINLDAAMLVTLADAGALDAIQRQFRIATTADDVARLRDEVADASVRDRLAQSLEALIARLAAGLDDGTYRAVPVAQTPERNPIERSFLHLLDAMRGGTAILWVDDRFTSAIDNPQFKTATTLEVIAALGRYGRLSADRQRALRQRLRAARWMFVPFDGGELVELLRAATRNGEVFETDDLAILRRAMGEMLRVRRRLQWPDPQAAEQEVRGEVPYLLDIGHAITQALATMWNDERWTMADAAVASRWIVDHLETGLYPLPVLAAGDPRSDMLIGTHLGGLVLTAIQIRPGKVDDPRKSAFLRWLAEDVVRPGLRVRPEFRASMDAMIEEFVVSDEGDERVDLWRALAGTTLNAMPDDLRLPLMARKRVRQDFGLSDHGMMSIEPYDFDEMDFWHAMATACTTGTVPIEAASGERGTVALLDEEDDRALIVTIEGKTLRGDIWPWAIASDDATERRAALATRADALDRSDGALAAIDDVLASLPAGERGRYILRLEHDGMARWYLDLAEKLAKRISFQVTDLFPEELLRLPVMLRFESDLDAAAAALLAERGLAIALRRFGGLPIVPPPALQAAIDGLEGSALTDALDEAGIDTAPPWTQLFVARLLLAHPALDDATRGRIARWRDQALAQPSATYWKLYIELARFAARYAGTIGGWQALSAAEQLIVCWAHASALAEIVIAANVRIDPLIGLLRQHRFVSPRLLVETQTQFRGDRADPLHLSLTRLKAFAAAPVLLEPDGDNVDLEAVHALLYANTGDGERLRVEIAQGGLQTKDALGSLFAHDWSAAVEAVETGAGALFGAGLTALAAAVLETEAAADREGTAWPFIAMVNGDTPFPADLADRARTSATMAFDANAAHGPHRDPHALRAFARIAGANGWTEHTAAIEAAFTALDAEALAADPDDAALVLEIAMARAMLEPDLLERTRVLGRHFTRLARIPALRDVVESAARQFARGLSGQLAEPFVDTLAEIWATY